MNDAEFVEEWRKTARKEIEQLESKGTWVEEPMENARSKILPGTWVFRRKRTPDGAIRKFKARYCVRGDLQQGVFDTYAPVVGWPTVRMFLVLALLLP
jgi:hypothetical protein